MPYPTLVDAEEFKQGMRRLAAAVNIVSTLEEGRPGGMLATAVCSVSAEPPSLLACVNRGSRTYSALIQSGAFCVNVLADDQLALARNFLSRKGADRFDMCGWSTLVTGSPAIDDAMINFDCEISGSFDAGSHNIIVGHVVAVRRRSNGTPLLYFEGDYRNLANAGLASA
ncbi:MAG: flavin reductase family protein [Pseudolabrys sp.]|jgi:flavin reductase (DIM6/NTAB) family NADH-FMN oxidoreductase RutF